MCIFQDTSYPLNRFYHSRCQQDNLTVMHKKEEYTVDMEIHTVVKVISFQKSSSSYTLDVGKKTYTNVLVSKFDKDYYESEFQFHETKNNETANKICKTYNITFEYMNKLNSQYSPQKYNTSTKFFAGFFIRIK